MPITIIYTNQDIDEYDLFEEITQITNFNLVSNIDCSNNELTSLPDMNFPNLQTFNCDYNKLTLLPDNMNCSISGIVEFSCSNNQLTSLPDNMNLPNLQKFVCSRNKLTSLPNNMNFPNLTKFYCCDNQLTSLPDNMNFPNLTKFYCHDNQLTSLPDNMNFPNLQKFVCSRNKLTSLPTFATNMNFQILQKFNCSDNQLKSLPNMNFPNLQEFNCSNNKLKSLPNMNFPNLQIFNCSNNQLTALPDNMNFPNLQKFYCHENQLTALPVCILNFRNIMSFSYHNNEIELSLQMARFIDRIKNKMKYNDKIAVYTDSQNIHNSTIQLCVRDSINRITTRTDLKKYNIEELHTLILWLQTNNLLTEISTQLLFEYVADMTVHSLLLLTFSEVLWFIIQTIITDFPNIIQQEIFKVLNQEIIDADCKCFTGRMNRVINCLNGFSPLVNINIKDGEQIGNIIILVKNKLESTGVYTVENHKIEVEKELLERNYDVETIKTWLEYIE